MKKSTAIKYKNKTYYIPTSALDDKTVINVFAYQDPDLKKIVKTFDGHTLIFKKKDIKDKLKENTMKKSDLLKMIREEIGLVLPNGIINGDPKGKEKSTVKKYKQKEKNITEAGGSITHSGINFLVIVSIRQSEGEVHYLPRTTKDIDALEKYGKDKVKLFLTTKTKQRLGFPIWDSSYSDESSFRFKFQVPHIEELILKKLI